MSSTGQAPKQTEVSTFVVPTGPTVESLARSYQSNAFKSSFVSSGMQGTQAVGLSMLDVLFKGVIRSKRQQSLLQSDLSSQTSDRRPSLSQSSRCTQQDPDLHLNGNPRPTFRPRTQPEMNSKRSAIYAYFRAYNGHSLIAEIYKAPPKRTRMNLLYYVDTRL